MWESGSANKCSYTDSPGKIALVELYVWNVEHFLKIPLLEILKVPMETWHWILSASFEIVLLKSSVVGFNVELMLHFAFTLRIIASFGHTYAKESQVTHLICKVFIWIQSFIIVIFCAIYTLETENKGSIGCIYTGKLNSAQECPVSPLEQYLVCLWPVPSGTPSRYLCGQSAS